MSRMITLAVAALLASGCVVNIPASWFGDDGSSFTVDGRTVHFEDGVFEVEGVPLLHDRWVTVSGSLDPDVQQLRMATATGAIDIEAAGDRSHALEVHLYSEVEGDGEVRFEGGRLEAVSAGGHQLLLNEVRGRAPDVLELRLESGMGHVVVAGFSGRRMDINCGMGDVRASGLSTTHVAIEAGMGAVTVNASEGQRLDAETGMGDLEIDGGRYDVMVLEAGMGAVVLRRSEAGKLEADVGMGSLRLTDTRITHLAADVGMGDLIFEGDSPSPETMDVDTGLGSVIHR